mmetsp:Transcript_75138/g.218126  ORF Transcript_75138/g.218126 Transcript_75138/m.218126 type:complete len:265 (+) Transcript_75138:174-968(+)
MAWALAGLVPVAHSCTPKLLTLLRLLPHRMRPLLAMPTTRCCVAFVTRLCRMTSTFFVARGMHVATIASVISWRSRGQSATSRAWSSQRSLVPSKIAGTNSRIRKSQSTSAAPHAIVSWKWGKRRDHVRQYGTCRRLSATSWSGKRYRRFRPVSRGGCNALQRGACSKISYAMTCPARCSVLDVGSALSTTRVATSSGVPRASVSLEGALSTTVVAVAASWRTIRASMCRGTESFRQNTWRRRTTRARQRQRPRRSLPRHRRQP